MHRDRADAERVARAQDAQRDLAAVGDDDFIEHGQIPRKGSGPPASIPRAFAGSRHAPLGSRAQPDHEQRLVELDRLPALSARTLSTVPEVSALDRVEHLIASMMPSVSPAFTACRR